MSVDEISEAIQQLPKVEIHVHLEGAMDAETVWLMAERNGVSLPADSLDALTQHYRFRDFAHFIEVYTTAASVMRTPEDWSFMVERFLHAQSRQNVVYSEVFLSASHQVGRFPLDEWVSAITEGAVRGEKLYGSNVRFIPDISRELPETQEAVLQCAIDAAREEHFIGLGLGGTEVGFPASLFAESFREARRNGLRVVAHAGETSGPNTISDAIYVLQAERIGHGIRCLDSPQLVDELRAMQMPLEVCPTSNYCLRVVDLDQPHPIRQMFDAGLRCTVNSDDPPMFGTTLNDEYRLLARQGFSLDELQQLNQNAVDACFLSDDAKDVIRMHLDDSL